MELLTLTWSCSLRYICKNGSARGCLHVDSGGDSRQEKTCAEIIIISSNDVKIMVTKIVAHHHTEYRHELAIWSIIPRCKGNMG